LTREEMGIWHNLNGIGRQWVGTVPYVWYPMYGTLCMVGARYGLVLVICIGSTYVIG
jgi:hypothetical protein